jgi:hypothetical protein
MSRVHVLLLGFHPSTSGVFGRRMEDLGEQRSERQVPLNFTRRLTCMPGHPGRAASSSWACDPRRGVRWCLKKRLPLLRHCRRYPPCRYRAQRSSTRHPATAAAAPSPRSNARGSRSRALGVTRWHADWNLLFKPTLALQHEARDANAFPGRNVDAADAPGTNRLGTANSTGSTTGTGAGPRGSSTAGTEGNPAGGTSTGRIDGTVTPGPSLPGDTEIKAENSENSKVDRKIKRICKGC